MEIEYQYTQTGKPVAVLTGKPRDLTNLILGVSALLSPDIHEDTRKKAIKGLESFMKELPKSYFTDLVQGTKEQKAFEESQGILKGLYVKSGDRE